ncbi:MAG: hypothetical protein BWK80_55590 [Desulfobacteraceae bacterium IS3]|nr:MAG: hypothetical protein BWK80_55590 [Desulfobacteraceae bacterium IS3]
MEVKGETYRITYESASATINCEGSLRLYGTSGYNEIVELFNKVADLKPKTITLKLDELKFLNSSGINALSKFVIRVRNHKTSELVIRGTKLFPWQGKSLKNLQRLMPEMKLEIS